MRRGALLLELVLALGLFVGAGLTIVGAMRQATRGLERARAIEQAADLARSAMAQLEAGIAGVEDLSGPVPAWVDEEASGVVEIDAPDEDSAWELEIETERSGFGELSLVTITARRTERPLASYTLRQIVFIGRPEDSDELPEDRALRELLEMPEESP